MSENKKTIITAEVKAGRKDRKENSRVMMLFESGNHVDVNASFYNAPSDVVRPIDAYVVTECGGECVQAARCAVEAVYSVYQELNPHKIGTRQVVAFGLEGSVVPPVFGNSGGLAFAISAAKHIFSHNPGPVAATGHVISSHGGGSVGGVKGIEAKVRSAMAKLPPGGFIVYPTENENEISDELRRAVADSGLQFHSVSSVREMLEVLFVVKADSGAEKMSAMSMLWILLGVLVAGGGIFSYAKWSGQQSVPVLPVVGEPSAVETGSMDSSTVGTGDMLSETKPVLVTTDNPEPAGENDEQLNASAGETSQGKETAVQQQMLNRGFD